MKTIEMFQGKRKKLLFFVLLTGLCVYAIAQTKAGDFVIQNGELIRYTGDSVHVVIPADLGITRIRDSVFYNSSIVSLVIPEGVSRLGYQAFHSSFYLQTINIPASVIDINDMAFLDCYSLREITVTQDNQRYASVDGVLFNKEMTELVRYPPARSGDYIIPNGVISIENGAFWHCTGLVSISVPGSLTSIITVYYRFSDIAFLGCDNLREIIVDRGSRTYTSLDGVLFNKNMTRLIRFPQGKSGAYAIPDSVTSIRENAFFSCDGLTSIAIPQSVISIEEDAFAGCASLEALVIPDSVTSIGSGAFQDCSSLVSLIIPNSITSIAPYAFNNCENLTSVYISASVTSIGDSAFAHCENLASVVIPDSVTTIDDGAFGSTGLVSLVIPGSVTSIGNWAFAYCAYLESLVISEGVTTIGVRAFEGCIGLTQIVIPNSVTSIGREAFAHCTGLVSLTIPNSVTDIDWDSFHRCNNLRQIIITSNGGDTSYIRNFFRGHEIIIR